VPFKAGRLGTLAGQVVQSNKTGAKPQGSYTMEEIAKHNKDTDCWVVISGKVYDVTSFLIDHPGGKDAIMLFAGQDATESFDMLHQPSVLNKFGPDF